MTLHQLRLLVASQPTSNDDKEVKVWLPGSRIGLEFNSGTMTMDPRNTQVLLIEGNVLESVME